MKVAIFGATGATGQILVNLCLAQGHEVTALARNPADLAPRPGLTIVPGDARNAANVATALTGTDAVLSALGARTLGPDDTLEQAITNIIAGMHTHGIRRIIVLGAAGALHDAMKHATLGRKIVYFIIRNTFLRHPMRDSGNQERLLEASDLDYTVVHPPRLLNVPPAGTYRVEPDGLPANGQSISRADVAEYMVAQLTNPATIRQGPYLAN
jgi:putative NADH-flavin reductase